MMKIHRGRQSWGVIRLVFGLFLLLVFVLPGCEKPDRPKTLVLNDFEGPADLERIVWSCRTTFSLSAAFRSHGQSGLMMTLYPAEYPGLSLRMAPDIRRWQGYRYLSLEVFNPGSNPLDLHYRIDDRKEPDYPDRVNGSFHLQPGENRLRLDLGQLRTSGSKRPLDLERIFALLFFQASPPLPISLGVDYLRLERE